MKYLFTIILLLILSCSSNCDSLDEKFSSYNNAVSQIRKTSFSIEEKVETNSSWIDGIEYYSCNEVSGFLIVTTKNGGNYTHKNVPIHVWNNFKNANSYGKFYNQNIKGNYYLSLK